jgi:uncharacterized phage protein (TIGR01671 family)
MFGNFKYRVWNKIEKSYSHTGIFVNQNGEFADNLQKYNLNQDNYVIEPCTNFTDVDGKLLYENDIVEFYLSSFKSRKIIGKIRYDLFGFFIYEKTGGIMHFTKQQYTLVGNSNYE